MRNKLESLTSIKSEIFEYKKQDIGNFGSEFSWQHSGSPHNTFRINQLSLSSLQQSFSFSGTGLSLSNYLSDLPQVLISPNLLKGNMEEENNPPYKWRIEQENKRNYQKSKVTEPEVEEKSNLFPNMPGVESYKMKVKIRSINDFIPKSFD